MKSRLGVSLLLLSLLTLPLAAQDASVPPPGGSLGPSLGGEPAPEHLVSVAIAVAEGGRLSGEVVRGTLGITIAEGWHINSAHPKDDFSIPTVAKLSSAGVRFEDLAYPPHVERAFTFAGGELLAVYEGSISIPFQGTRTAGGAVAIDAVVSYQACNDRVCLPPRSEKARVEIGADGVAVIPPTTGAPGEAAVPEEGFVPLSEAPPAGSGSLFSGDIGSTFESRGIALTLLVVFVLGLALNLTPCVYPLIPLTLAYFSSQTEGKASRRFGLATSYVLGLAAMYSALGVFSALSGRLFGAWLQLPAVLIFFALLMLVLSASMFGAFEIRVPHFISDRAGARSGYAGAAMMGLLAGIVAAPCVGPFIISLIALVGQKGSVAFGFLLFFVLALGLGFPYLILGVFSSSIRAIPRSGAWMVQIKQALGFVLIAMAFYFLRPLTGDAVYHWGAGLSLLFGAAFLMLRPAPGARAIRFASAILLLAGGLYFLWPRPHAAEIQWTKYEASALADARAAGKPVVIDFYADWCLPCKELDAKTFTDPAVIAEAERFVRLKADLTNSRDETVLRLSKEYSILGVPTIVFIGAGGDEIDSARL
ncbi:MAG TPA: cytochrome c biogenesis protein CcdA, partial [Thermoanaerobaculia bacterium]|nr:cytochrome c biogenesis protein CcdA [Thermoanaerobaculia bacterium]